MEDNKTHRRYIVDRAFQWKYTFFVVAGSSLAFWILGYFLYQQSRANTEILNIQNPELLRLVEGSDWNVLYMLLGFFLLQVASLCIMGILLTHRIAGPLHRAQKHIEEVTATRDIRPMASVRSHDEFPGFFEALTDMLAKLRDQQEGDHARIQEALTALEKAKQSPDSAQKAREILENLPRSS